MTLRLEFDRGTLLCRALPADVDPAGLPGVRFDARVGCHRAPAWLHARIAARLVERGVVFDDAVAAPLPGPGPLVSPELRPYQAAALDAWRLAGRRGVVCLPTGSGKTRVALAAIAELGRSVLCLVPTRILLEQWRSVLGAALARPIGCHGDGFHELRPVTVATFESAWRHMHRLGNRFELLVVDEVHHFGAGRHDEALEMSTARWRLGLTATPAAPAARARSDELVGPIVYQLALGDLTGRYLADFELVELRLELAADERVDYERLRERFGAVHAAFRELAPAGSWSDFARWAARTPQGRAALDAWRESRALLSLTRAKRAALRSLLRAHGDARVLVFTADREAAYQIARDELVMPITADIERRERAAMLAAFERGEVRALVSARVLNEGFDLPTADVGIVVGGAQGEREHVQRIGRLLRPAPEKRAIVYELVTRGTAEVDHAQRRRRGLGARRAGPL